MKKQEIAIRIPGIDFSRWTSEAIGKVVRALNLQPSEFGRNMAKTQCKCPAGETKAGEPVRVDNLSALSLMDRVGAAVREAELLRERAESLEKEAELLNERLNILVRGDNSADQYIVDFDDRTICAVVVDKKCANCDAAEICPESEFEQD